MRRAAGHRGCVILRGSAQQTRERAAALVGALASEAVAWIESGSARAQLGQSFDAVVADFHAGVDADVLGQIHGLVRGGGCLILRLGPRGEGPDPERQARLAASPHRAQDVGRRFDARIERALERWFPGAEDAAHEPLAPEVIAAVDGDHPEQARVVERLVELWSGAPSRCALLADRGRGKSSALGLALARLGPAGGGVAVCAPQLAAVTELYRFAGADASGSLRFVTLPELVFGDARFDLIVVDEAAQLPVPLLRRLVEVHGRAHLCFSTTTHGYEGTGRGFSLRFLAWLERGPEPLVRLGLSAPIRWSAGDPVEAMVFDALLLDAEPARVTAALATNQAIDRSELDLDVEAARVDRDRLAHDELALRELFGLLVHAHYRTTPGDLHRLLDAPNLAVHVLRWRGHIVAATLVAEEGGLPASLAQALVSGQTRLRAHALPEVLVAHLAKPEAGAMTMIRSVRIATHPALRRAGLASALVEHVHDAYAPELFGTLFGATPALLAFRRSLGYELVRVSASRGARAGEPSVMMLRPRSARASALMTELRAELARDLPRQLELLEAEASLEPELRAALCAELPAPAQLSDATCDALVRSYAFGPRTFESVAHALARWLARTPERLERLEPGARALVEGRVIAGHAWPQVAEDAGFPSVAAAMRALRRAVRAMLEGDPR